MTRSLKEIADIQLANETKEQSRLYENTVGIVIDTSTNPDEIAAAYDEYQRQLHHFNPAAFRKTLDVLRNEVCQKDPERYAKLASEFKFIPEYINHRNNFNEKRKALLSTNGSSQDKQAMFDTLDRQRTRAHNGVIKLFNNLNRLAKENQLAVPYPNDGEEFDENNWLDREKVANVLTRHEPVLDTVNKFMTKSLNDLELEDPYEKLKRMNLKQLAEYAIQHQTVQHHDDINLDLTDLSNTQDDSVEKD